MELESTKLESDDGDGTYSSTRIYFMYIISVKRGVFFWQKFVECLCEFGSKIEELEPTKLETDHGAGTYSSTRIYFVYVIFGKRGVFCEKFDKIRQRLCEFGSKIEGLEPTKLETVHGDGTHSSTRTYFKKFDKTRQMFVRIWIQNRGVRVDKTRNR